MRPLDYIMESGFLRIDAAVERVIAKYPEKKVVEKNMCAQRCTPEDNIRMLQRMALQQQSALMSMPHFKEEFLASELGFQQQMEMMSLGRMGQAELGNYRNTLSQLSGLTGPNEFFGRFL